MQEIENETWKVAIDPLGAELKSLYHKVRRQEFLWQGDPAWWPRRAPVLFPIVGKVSQNTIRVDGRSYTLPQHGFARDSQFELVHHDAAHAEFILRSGPATLAKFPFPFELTIGYTLRATQLLVYYKVHNTGTTLMNFSIGAHPGFALREGEQLSDYYIEFEHKETLDRHLLDEGLFNGSTERIATDAVEMNLSDAQMQKDAIVFKGLKSASIKLKSRRSDYNLRFSAPGFPYFGIWSKPGAPFVCLEPWCGMADNKGFMGELRDKEGIESLHAGGEFFRSFSIES